MSDLRLLFWLRWRQLRDALVYGLRLLGYESGERIYGLYLLSFLLFWLAAMSSYAFDAAARIGSLLHPDQITALLDTLPVLILVGQAWVVSSALRSTPLKLTFADMAYVAASPINPMSAVILGYARQVLNRVIIFVPLAALFGAMLARAVFQDTSIAVGASTALRMMIPTLLIVILTLAAAWLVGTLRLVYAPMRRIPLLWLLPFVLIPLVPAAPDVVLFMGNSIFDAGVGELSIVTMLFYVVLSAVLIAGLVYFGSRVDMIQAVEESQMYARIQSLGLMAWRQPDVTLRIRMQSFQAPRRAWLRLPKGLGNWRIIAARAALTYVRHPIMLLTAAGWGALMTLAASYIIQSNLPFPLVVGWVLIAGFAPPVGLLYVYRADVEEPFLRQFLLVDGFALMLCDTALPLIALLVGALGMWFLQTNLHPDVWAGGFTLIPMIALIQTLGGAMAATRGDRALQTRLLALVISYAVVGVGFAVLGSGGAFIAAGLVLMTLIGLVGDSV